MMRIRIWIHLKVIHGIYFYTQITHKTKKITNRITTTQNKTHGSQSNCARVSRARERLVHITSKLLSSLQLEPLLGKVGNLQRGGTHVLVSKAADGWMDGVQLTFPCHIRWPAKTLTPFLPHLVSVRRRVTLAKTYGRQLSKSLLEALSALPATSVTVNPAGVLIGFGERSDESGQAFHTFTKIIKYIEPEYVSSPRKLTCFPSKLLLSLGLE